MSNRKLLGSMVYLEKSYVINEFGQEAFEKLLSEIPDETIREKLSKPVLSNQWYDLDVHREFARAADKTLGRENFKKIYYYNAEKGLSGFFGFVAKVMPIKMIFGQTDKLWLKVFSEGQMRVIEESGNGFTARLTEYETTDIHLLAAMYWMEKFFSIISGKPTVGEYRRVDNSTTDFIYKFG